MVTHFHLQCLGLAPQFAESIRTFRGVEPLQVPLLARRPRPELLASSSDPPAAVLGGARIMQMSQQGPLNM